MISFSSFSLSFPIFSVKIDNVIVSCTPVQSHIRPYLFWNDIFFCTYTDNLSQWKVAVDSNILSVTVSVVFFFTLFLSLLFGCQKENKKQLLWPAFTKMESGRSLCPFWKWNLFWKKIWKSVGFLPCVHFQGADKGWS